MNIGILNANGTYIVHMDAYAEHSPDYISKCLETMKRTKADNVSGPVVAGGKKKKQRVVDAA